MEDALNKLSSDILTSIAERKEQAINNYLMHKNVSYLTLHEYILYEQGNKTYIGTAEHGFGCATLIFDSTLKVTTTKEL